MAAMDSASSSTSVRRSSAASARLVEDSYDRNGDVILVMISYHHY